MQNIDIPYDWVDISADEHPESTDLVDSCARFKHTGLQSELIIWEKSTASNTEGDIYEVELRNATGELIMSEKFRNSSLKRVYSYAQEQMEIYPVQEVLSTN